ncbi:MAG: hypothetical protein AABN34_10955 [Acidobacteriota bacterium]
MAENVVSPAVIQEPKMVKCITCGFAAKQARIALPGQGNRQYFDIPYEEREGYLVLITGFKASVSDGVDIACFRGRPGLVETYKKILDGPPPESGYPVIPLFGVSEWPRYHASRMALEEERVCDGWRKHEPGRSPHEQLSDEMWERLEEQRRKFEMRLFELGQESQKNTQIILADSKAVAEANRDIVRELKSLQESGAGFNRRVNIWLIFLTALTLLLAGLQVYFAARPAPPAPPIRIEWPDVKTSQSK